MKQRVTNERVKELMESNTVTISSVADIRNLCHDLLEARDLLRDVIKGLEYIYCLDVNPTTTVLSNATRWSLCSRKAIELLAKTKDYAE